MNTLTSAQQKSLSEGILQFFRMQDKPPADEIIVAPENVRVDTYKKALHFATIKYVTNYCSRREHSVKIRFYTDTKGRFISRSYEYVS